MKTMKYVLTNALLFLFFFGIQAQEEKADTIRIKTPKREITIKIDDDGDPTFDWSRNTTTYRGLSIWQGVDFGVNGYFTGDNFEINNDPDNIHMELNFGNSFILGLNFVEYHTNLIGERFRIGTGLGMRFNRYSFKNSNTTLTFNDTEVFPVLDNVKVFDKNFMNITYVSAPIYLTWIPSKKPQKSLRISAGGLMNYRIGSRTKQRYTTNDQKGKDLNRGHYHLTPFLFDASVRIGIADFALFANYSLNALFEKNKGPQYRPFSVGLSWTL